MGCSFQGVLFGDSHQIRVDELVFGVQGIHNLAIDHILARADLSACDGHLGVAPHMATFSTAKHGGFHQWSVYIVAHRIVGDGHLGIVDRCYEVEEADGVGCRGTILDGGVSPGVI